MVLNSGDARIENVYIDAHALTSTITSGILQPWKQGRNDCSICLSLFRLETLTYAPQLPKPIALAFLQQSKMFFFQLSKLFIEPVVPWI